jgi:hypothetical protein
MTKFDSLRPGTLGAPTKGQHDLRNVAREHAQEALALIVKVLNSPRATPQARIAAARSLLERSWGESLLEQVRPHRQDALDTLLGIMNDTGASLRTRLVAADVLLEYGGSEARARVSPTVAIPLPNAQRWLDELKEIQEQFAAGRSTVDRPATSTPR